jgi:hypothetical protein
MFRFMRVSLLATGIVLSILGVSAQAQEATPGSPQDIPSASECATDPVSFLSILAMLNEVEDAQFAPSIGSVDESLIEEGSALTAEDAAGIEWTTRQLVACANGGNPFQVIPLLTEQFQARLVVNVMEGGGVDTVIEQLPMLASQTAESEGIAAIPVADAWYDPITNKVIYAILEPAIEEAEQQPRFLVTYVYSVTNWVIDDVQFIEE